MEYFIIYKTTNILNGKYYIGKHKTNNLDDKYLGSGIALQGAIKKYGRKNFIKEILFLFDTEEEMNLKESEIVNEAFCSNRNNYNLALGGQGGVGHLHKDTAWITDGVNTKRMKIDEEIPTGWKRARPINWEFRPRGQIKWKKEFFDYKNKSINFD